jgi:hypothetical protein
MEKLARAAMTFPTAPRRDGFKLWFILVSYTGVRAEVAGN